MLHDSRKALGIYAVSSMIQTISAYFRSAGFTLVTVSIVSGHISVALPTVPVALNGGQLQTWWGQISEYSHWGWFAFVGLGS